MSIIDKQRVAAVRTLEAMGYAFDAGEWRKPTDANSTPPAPWVGDALHAMLVERADVLKGCPPGSSEEGELAAITDAIEAYEAIRWPLGVERGRGDPPDFSP